jgi:hypothetical protein
LSGARDARDLIASCYSRNPFGLYGCPCCGRRFKVTAKLELRKRIAAKWAVFLPQRDLIRHDQRSHRPAGAPRWNLRSVDSARRLPKYGTAKLPDTKSLLDENCVKIYQSAAPSKCRNGKMSAHYWRIWTASSSMRSSRTGM